MLYSVSTLLFLILMDNLTSNQLQIVLGIKAGTGFGFTSLPIVVVAGLNNNKLETDRILPSSELQFETELVWEADKKYFRRLRTGNTPLKVECFTVINQHKREKVGYVLLNLKQAQVIPRCSQINLLESWYRLLGLRNEAKSHNPELLLTLKVEETSLKSKCSETHTARDSINIVSSGANTMRFDSVLRRENEIHIGPDDQCTQKFELSVQIAPIDTLMPSPKIAPVRLQFSVFGSGYSTRDLVVSQGSEFGDNIRIYLTSNINVLFIYFKNFPCLFFKIMQGDQILKTLLMELKDLVPSPDLSSFLNHCNKINSEGDSTASMVRARFDIDELPVKTFIDVTVRLLYKGELFASNENIVSQEQVILPLKGESREQQMNNPHRPVTPPEVIPKTLLESPKELPVSEVCPAETDSTPVKDDQKCNKVPDTQLLPLDKKLEPATAGTEIDFKQKEFTRDTAFRICEELEDWKEQQQEIFKSDLKRKTEKHLEKLSFEWLKRQKEIEDDFTRRLELCKELTENLSVASRELTHRSDEIVKREKELAEAEEKLNKLYSERFQELREASRRYQADTEHRLDVATREKRVLLEKINLLEKENRMLKEGVTTFQSYEDQLTSDQTANLIMDMKSLEEKLEAALESKTFFKEEWGKAVREIHRLREEQQQQIKLQIERSKEELGKLGLVEEITYEENELKEDLMTLKSLRCQLLEFQGLSENRDHSKQNRNKFDTADNEVADLNGNGSTLMA